MQTVLMKKLLCLLLCALAGQAQATGYFRSGSDLEELDAILALPWGHVGRVTFAKGYVAGVADATSGITWCPNSQVTEELIFNSVSKFMRSHAASLNRGAATIVGDALAADYPCDKK